MPSSRLTLSVVLHTLLILAACSKAPVIPPEELCTPGETTDCSCGKGRMGTMTCDATGYFGDCVCEASDAGGSGADGGQACASGQSRPCTCASGGSGTQLCNDDGTFDVCECEQTTDGGSADPCEHPQPEVCDGRDNDCNHVIDDGETCTGGTVKNTDPFTGVAYLQGGKNSGECGDDAMLPVWPTRAAYLDNFECGPSYFQFRPTDNALFYYNGTGILQHNPSGPDTVVPTPPCGVNVEEQFGFDGTGTMYYRCGVTTYHGGKEDVHGALRLAAVLSDGRYVLMESYDEFVVYDNDGKELSRLAAPAVLSGEDHFSAGFRTSTSQGNSAFIGFDRGYGSGTREVAAYRLDASSQWSLMRRVVLDGYSATGFSYLVLSDGTVLVRAAHFSPNYYYAEAYLPDHTVRQVYKDTSNEVVHYFGSAGASIAFFTGPK